MTSYVFTHATVLDGTEGMEPQPNMTVVVNEGIIEKVGPAATTVGPFGAREIDLAGAYLAPGYEAAVMTSGVCGFGLGATPNAIANMTAMTELFGPAPTAFFVIPLIRQRNGWYAKSASPVLHYG